MPVVPITSGTKQPAPVPSETSMLMALAEMHKQGRFEEPQVTQVGYRGPIRDEAHLNRLINNADSDQKLMEIKRQLERQGMDSSVIEDLNPGKSK